MENIKSAISPNGHLFSCSGQHIHLTGKGPQFKTRRKQLDLQTLGFPGGSDSKESACNVGDLGSIPGVGRSPGGGHDNPLQYACLENPHGQRSLSS